MSTSAEACTTGDCQLNDGTPASGTAADGSHMAEAATVPMTFVPPPFAAVPSITIEFCDRCRWLHRATWVQTELFLTFPSPTIESITLIPQRAPETSGRFRVWLYWKQTADTTDDTSEAPNSNNEASTVVEELLWDRKTEGGFPELKILKQKIRDRLTPNLSLGHSDKKTES